MEVLAFIINNVEKLGFPPSVREICEKFNMKSTATAFYYLKKLEKIGAIERDSSKNRHIRVSPEYMSDKLPENLVRMPMVGKIAAGQPITAIENKEDEYVFARELFKGDDQFILKVQGESMIEAGIFDGDMVIVNPQQTANNGDIVVALLEDEATLKRFFIEADGIRLQAENSSMADIFVKDVQILGLAVGLIRNRL